MGPCFYCKKPGHRIADCPKRLAKEGAVGGGFAKHANSSFPMNTPCAPAPYGVPGYPMPVTGAPSQPVYQPQPAWTPGYPPVHPPQYATPQPWYPGQSPNPMPQYGYPNTPMMPNGWPPAQYQAQPSPPATQVMQGPVTQTGQQPTFTLAPQVNASGGGQPMTTPAMQPHQPRQNQHRSGSHVVNALTGREISSIDDSGAGDITRCAIVVEGDYPTPCVLDSAAGTSVVSKEFLERIGKVMKKAPMRDLLAANGSGMSVLGTVDLEFTIGPIRIVHPLEVVENFLFPVLLGKDFLRRKGIRIDFETGLVEVRSPSRERIGVRLLEEYLEDGVEGLGKEDTADVGRVCAITSPVSRNQVIVKAEVAGPEVPKRDPDWRPSGLISMGEDLTEEQVTKLSALVDAYGGIFASGTSDMGRMAGIYHHIDTGDSHPINQSPYPCGKSRD